MYNVKA